MIQTQQEQALVIIQLTLLLKAQPLKIWGQEEVDIVTFKQEKPQGKDMLSKANYCNNELWDCV